MDEHESSRRTGLWMPAPGGRSDICKGPRVRGNVMTPVKHSRPSESVRVSFVSNKHKAWVI